MFKECLDGSYVVVSSAGVVKVNKGILGAMWTAAVTVLRGMA